MLEAQEDRRAIARSYGFMRARVRIGLLGLSIPVEGSAGTWEARAIRNALETILYWLDNNAK